MVETRLESIVNVTPISIRHKLVSYINGDDSCLSIIERQNFERMKSIACNCTENWWEGSAQEKAYCQYKCPTQILDFDVYRQAMQILLRRQVDPSELFGEAAIDLKEEVEEKYFLYSQVMK